MEYMNGRYVEAGFINPQQKNQVLLDDWRKIHRYIRDEQRKPLIRRKKKYSLLSLRQSLMAMKLF